jgi:hypothetical protein
MLILGNLAPMTDIKALIDQLAFLVSGELMEITKSKPLPPAQIDEKLMTSVELFLAILKGAVQTAEDSPYEVRKHQLFEIQNLKSLVSKYFLTSAQILQDASGDLTIGVRDLFDVSTTDHANALRSLKTTYTEAMVFKHLTSSVEKLARGQMSGYQKQDFESAAYAPFIDRETKHLTTLISVFGLGYPQAVSQSSSANPLKNIPEDVKIAEKYYKVLVTLCFERDLAASSGGLSLSKLSKSILNECAIIWNICKDFKDAAIFDSIVKKYAAGTLGLNEIFPLFKSARKSSAEYRLLRKTDRNLLLNAYLKLKLSLNTQIQQFLGMVHLQRLTADDCSSVLKLVSFMSSEINDDPLCHTHPSLARKEEADLEDEIADEIKLSTADRLDYIQTKISQAFPAQDQITLRISKMIQTFSADLKKYKAYYPMEIFDRRLVFRIAANEYIVIANEQAELLKTIDLDTSMLQILELYDVFREFYDGCFEMGVDHTLIIQIETYFMPMIDSWLLRTDSKWLDWAKRAYAIDQFEPVSSPKALNSTSILDLFSAFQGALTFVTKFRFKDSNKQEQLKRSFITGIHKILVTYCKLVFEEFEIIDNHGHFKMEIFTSQVYDLD